MKTLESYIDITNIDKSDWNVYKFDKIAKSIGEKVEPTKTDLEIYVGLEHLDPDCIHINRFGKKDDVTGTKLRCRPGDVIFGRRRAYQRKAAIVEFNGFCSAHSLVLRANPNVIDPRLFPFFLHSDMFMNRAVDISVGSLSPTINWGTLKNEEFLLPLKDQQARLAELLWASDAAIELYKNLVKSMRQAKKVFFLDGIRTLKHIPISKIGRVSYGLGQPPATDENGVAMIRATNISRGTITSKDMMRINREAISKGKDVFLSAGDLIVVRSGAYTGDVAMITSEWEGAVAGYDLVLRVDKEKINSLWLTEYLLGDENQARFKGDSIRSAQPHLNSEQLLSTRVPDIDINIQNRIALKLESQYSALKSAENHVLKMRQLQKCLINQIF